MKREHAWLKRRLDRVRVHSCADGSFTIEARWKQPYFTPGSDINSWRDLPPGMFTRMDTAEYLERVLNRVLGGAKRGSP